MGAYGTPLMPGSLSPAHVHASAAGTPGGAASPTPPRFPVPFGGFADEDGSVLGSRPETAASRNLFVGNVSPPFSFALSLASPSFRCACQILY